MVEEQRIRTLAESINDVTKDYTYVEIHNALALYFTAIGLTLLKNEDSIGPEELIELSEKHAGTYPGFLFSLSLNLLATVKNL